MTRALLILAAAIAPLVPQGDGIIRLKPSDFRQLPAAVRRNLDKRGCSIPQSTAKTAPHNVISGSFIAKGSRDWAVLCSVNRTSRILVYRNGAAARVDSLAPRSDEQFMQGGRSGMEFSRKLDIAAPKAIADMARELGGPKPPPLDHEGIEDNFVGKASEIQYYYRAKWVKLQGAD